MGETLLFRCLVAQGNARFRSAQRGAVSGERGERRGRAGRDGANEGGAWPLGGRGVEGEGRGLGDKGPMIGGRVFKGRSFRRGRGQVWRGEGWGLSDGGGAWGKGPMSEGLCLRGRGQGRSGA